MTDFEGTKDGPSEMQAIINGLRGDLHNLYMMAGEPGQTPVHPKETIDRDEVLGAEIAMQHIDNADQALDELSDMDF